MLRVYGRSEDPLKRTRRIVCIRPETALLPLRPTVPPSALGMTPHQQITHKSTFHLHQQYRFSLETKLHAVIIFKYFNKIKIINNDSKIISNQNYCLIRIQIQNLVVQATLLTYMQYGSWIIRG